MELSIPSHGSLLSLLPSRTPSRPSHSPSLVILLPRHLPSPKLLLSESGFWRRDMRALASSEEPSSWTFMSLVEKMEEEEENREEAEEVSGKKERVDVIDGGGGGDEEQSESAEFLNKLDVKIPNDIVVNNNGEETLSEVKEASEKKEGDAFVDGGDGEQSESTEFLNKLDLKLDSGHTYSLIIYGTGALFAVWLSSAVVGAIDSIPVFPKVMEVVGLAYTTWFSYRYLIFKENREELFAKIEDLKKQTIGTTDD